MLAAFSSQRLMISVIRRAWNVVKPLVAHPQKRMSDAAGALYNYERFNVQKRFLLFGRKPHVFSAFLVGLCVRHRI
jgi:hypothetical protein